MLFPPRQFAVLERQLLFEYYIQSQIFHQLVSCTSSLNVTSQIVSSVIPSLRKKRKNLNNDVSKVRVLRNCTERCHMTSRYPEWCSKDKINKTNKRWPCWCTEPILRELNSFLIKTLPFVPVNLHGGWARGWKRFFPAIRAIRYCLFAP